MIPLFPPLCYISIQPLPLLPLSLSSFRTHVSTTAAMEHAAEAPTDNGGRPLSSPKTMDQIHTASIVILIVATLSAIGAGWMIISFMVRAFASDITKCFFRTNTPPGQQGAAHIQTPAYSRPCHFRLLHGHQLPVVIGSEPDGQIYRRQGVPDLLQLQRFYDPDICRPECASPANPCAYKSLTNA